MVFTQLLRMDQCMKDNGKMIKDMEKESTFLKMEVIMMANGFKAKEKAKDLSLLTKITIIRVIGKMARKKDLASKLRAVVTNTKGYSKIVLNMERENFHLQMETSMRDNFSLAINQAMECIFSKIRINTKAIG